MLSFPPTVRVFVCREPVDMRTSFDGLAGCVEQHLHSDPLNGHVYVFFNRRASAVFDKKEHIVVERVPAQYTATCYIQLVYGCPYCKDGVCVAEPKILPIAKGLGGACQQK